MVGGKLVLTGACKLKKKKISYMKTSCHLLKTGGRIFRQLCTCFKQTGACFCFVAINRRHRSISNGILNNSFVWLWKFNLFSIITPRTLCSLTLFFTRFYFLYFFQDLENGISLYSASCNFGKSIESMYGNLYINYS